MIISDDPQSDYSSQLDSATSTLISLITTGHLCSVKLDPMNECVSFEDLDVQDSFVNVGQEEAESKERQKGRVLEGLVMGVEDSNVQLVELLNRAKAASS